MLHVHSNLFSLVIQVGGSSPSRKQNSGSAKKQMPTDQWAFLFVAGHFDCGMRSSYAGDGIARIPSHNSNKTFGLQMSSMLANCAGVCRRWWDVPAHQVRIFKPNRRACWRSDCAGVRARDTAKARRRAPRLSRRGSRTGFRRRGAHSLLSAPLRVRCERVDWIARYAAAPPIQPFQSCGPAGAVGRW